MKIIFIVIDGLGDKPLAELGNKTPLQAAKTQNMDWLAKKGSCGLLEPVFSGALPTSEQGHLSLFGYNPKTHKIGRGLIEAVALGLKIKPGDVVLRGNWATVDDNLNMIDRRAGRITTGNPLIKALSGKKINGIKFLIYPVAEHRIALILRGKGLSESISDGDPHYGKMGTQAKKIIPLDKSLKAKFTAKVLNEFLMQSHQILKDHPLNKKRQRAGLFPANYILTRGAGSLKKIDGFKKKYNLKAACVAGKNLYKGIARVLGMELVDVKGADGSTKTNLKGKFLAAKNCLKKYDFVFLHIKAADSLAEDGDFKGKKEFIEKIDKNFKLLLDLENTLIIVTSDHSTCCCFKRHCAEPIPLLIHGGGWDFVKKFSEKDCKKGKLGKFKQLGLMKRVLKLSGRS